MDESPSHESSSLKIYLRDISKTPLLTQEEEVALAERIQQGDPEARSHLIKANLRLVVKIAQDYAPYGLPVTDLISEGNLGLMKAAERFDPRRGAKFSTYGAWWIKQSIKRALANQSKTIRLPLHMVDKIAKMRRIALMLAEALGRDPTDEEIAEELGLPRLKITHLKEASQSPSSLDAPIHDEGGNNFGDTLADEHAENPHETLSQSNMSGELDGLLDLLDERERTIIEVRFGLGDKKALTLDKVGEQFGVTRERIRQLQNSALEKMRNALRDKENFPLGKPQVIQVSQDTGSGEQRGNRGDMDNKKNTSRSDNLRPLSIANEKEYNRYRELLLNHEAVTTLMESRGDITAKAFLKKIRAIVLPGERYPADEILQAVLTYSYASGQGTMPQKIKTRHYLKLLGKPAA